MTVQELVAVLSKLPPNAEILLDFPLPGQSDGYTVYILPLVYNSDPLISDDESFIRLDIEELKDA